MARLYPCNQVRLCLPHKIPSCACTILPGKSGTPSLPAHRNSPFQTVFHGVRHSIKISFARQALLQIILHQYWKSHTVFLVLSCIPLRTHCQFFGSFPQISVGFPLQQKEINFHIFSRFSKAICTGTAPFRRQTDSAITSCPGAVVSSAAP